VFIPLQFAKTAGGIITTAGGTIGNPDPGAMNPPVPIGSMAVTPRPKVHISNGNLAGALHLPNDGIPGAGAVPATGIAPATLRVPVHRSPDDAMTAIPLNGITLAQISTNFGIDGPFATATLAPGGGPGSFTWCPGDPACVVHGGMLMTDPPQGMQCCGRVIYRRGAN